jgi:hypothetical protein
MVSILRGRHFQPIEALLCGLGRYQPISEVLLWTFGTELAYLPVTDVLSVPSEIEHWCHQQVKPAHLTIPQFLIYATFMPYLGKCLCCTYSLFIRVSININASVCSYKAYLLKLRV